MAARRHARGVGQRRIDPDEPRPDPEEAPPPESPADAPPPGRRPEPIEEMPGGSASLLLERQRRWIRQRDRRDRADRRTAGAAEPPATGPG